MSKATEMPVAATFKLIFDWLDVLIRAKSRGGFMSGWRPYEQEIPSLTEFDEYCWDSSARTRMCPACYYAVVREIPSFRSFCYVQEGGRKSFVAVFFETTGSILLEIPATTQDQDHHTSLYSMGDVRSERFQELSYQLVRSFESVIFGWKPPDLGKVA